ncbi:MAG TPA: NAD(P)H-quinone oxidoreductase [Alphaproteobacteria bacterium]|nr:NAD(P)H-quinone oxidoreductase [Alphaproteobacteria bacterium]
MSELPQTMRAIAITKPGGPEMLQPVSLPTPAPGRGEVLIRVAAAGVNRPDVMQRQGFYPPPPGAPETPGLEVAGTIAAIGEGVSGWKSGDRVCALVAGGGYAEYCVAPAPQCLTVPEGLNMVEAAAIPETFFTVWTNLFDGGRLKSGEALLVHGGGSGIGTSAIQIAKAFGARVFATAGSEEKCRACVELGAERAINYRSEDFVEVVKQLTGGAGVDVILDMVGGDYVARNIAALAPGGRHVSIAFLQGSKVNLNLLPVLQKRLILTGSGLRPRSIAEKGQIADALRTNLWPLLAAGRIRPVIDSTYPLDQAAAAHTRMESSAHTGKLVLTL